LECRKNGTRDSALAGSAPHSGSGRAKAAHRRFALANRACKRYPAKARSSGEQGIATVAFTIDRQGRLLTSRIVKSSGSPMLDQETLAMLGRA
jgi:periplasmic protein TonB